MMTSKLTLVAVTAVAFLPLHPVTSQPATKCHVVHGIGITVEWNARTDGLPTEHNSSVLLSTSNHNPYSPMKLK